VEGKLRWSWGMCAGWACGPLWPMGGFRTSGTGNVWRGCTRVFQGRRGAL